MSDTPRLQFAFICDDARREDNGKILLIGVYGQTMVLSQLPAQLLLCQVTWFETDSPRNSPFKSRVFLDETLITEGGGELHFAEGVSIALFPRIPIFIDKPGKLIFQVRMEAGEWETAVTMPVILRPPATASTATGPLPPASQSPTAS
jgi:hypothetical protein